MSKEKTTKKEENIQEKECCGHDCRCDEEVVKFDTENDINVAVIKDNKDLLLNENCCTCINIMLANDGRILTSFFGSHNPYIVEQLEKAQKVYFKNLKKALKKNYFEEDCHCVEGEECTCGDECHCGDSCTCQEGKCECGDNCTCGDDCDCGCKEGKCTCDNDKETKYKSKKKKSCNK